jgi:hypothetical protein
MGAFYDKTSDENDILSRKMLLQRLSREQKRGN